MTDKVYISGKINKIKVGMRCINLSGTALVKPDGSSTVKNNSPVTVYDTAGPYSDPRLTTSIENGIERIREEWHERRKDILMQEELPSGPGPGGGIFPVRQPVFRAKEGRQITQMYYAKKRIITPEMEYVAIRENQQVEALGLKSYITPDFVRKEVAAGRAIIPSSINHPEVEPMIIGRRFLVKVNTNMAPAGDPVEDDIRQMVACCRWGADTLMDLSSLANCHQTREWLIRNCPVPVGTSPLYQALAKAGGNAEELSWGMFRDTLVEQARQGVDFVAIHAAMRKKHLRYIDNRLTNLVSHSGAILCRWMKAHREDNFLYVHFPEICEILKAYDMSVSIGSGLRPGSIYDANDRAQLAELAEMRTLVELAWDQFVQVMVEGAGHIPLNKIETSVREYLYSCKGAPLFTLGMTSTDIAGQYDHIASAIGSAQTAWHGASLISGNMLKGYAGLPAGNGVVKTSIIAHKIAAHAADLAKGHPGAQVRDNALGKARREGRSDDLFSLTLDAGN
jgi:phosphomethylpyrimidine synthase